MTTYSYSRVSTEDQTCEHQDRVIQERYRIDLSFSDRGVSGTVPFSERPEASRLLATLKAGDTLVVSAIDRLGRNSLDVCTTVEHLQATGVAVVSLREGFDLSTATGKAMFQIIMAMAELERNLISERTKTALATKKANGWVHPNTVDADEERIREMKTQGYSLRSIAGQLGLSLGKVQRVLASQRN